MTFSEHLRILRENEAVTQKEIAQKVGISLPGYQNYEYGLREPRMSHLIALADFYGLTLDELVCRERTEDTAADQRDNPELMPREDERNPKGLMELRQKALLQMQELNDGQVKAVLAFLNCLDTIEKSLADGSQS